MTGRQTPFENRTMGATARLKGHRIVKAYLERQGRAGEATRRQIHLVSYPRSGNTLMRRYLSILQGRAQQSAYADDVIDAATVALTRELDGFDIVKSHQLPDDEKDVIYILRDGRNATLSFLYMNFLAGGHSFSRPNQTWDAIRQLDEQEGSWSEHERCRRHFHEHGGPEALMHFGYERSSDWWQT